MLVQGHHLKVLDEFLGRSASSTWRQQAESIQGSSRTVYLSIFVSLNLLLPFSSFAFSLSISHFVFRFVVSLSLSLSLFFSLLSLSLYISHSLTAFFGHLFSPNFSQSLSQSLSLSIYIFLAQRLSLSLSIFLSVSRFFVPLSFSRFYCLCVSHALSFHPS